MQDYKNNKILELKKEMVKVPNQTDYEINGIDTSRALFFYRKEKEKFKVIPRGSYTIVDVASNKYLRITDSNLLSEAIEFQVCYLFVKTSSSYIDDFPEIVLLQEHYNQLYEDFNNLLQQLQSNNILGDTLKMSYVLPQLNEGQVWVLRQGEMVAENIFDLDARLQEVLEQFKILFSKWVDNTEKPRIDAYVDEKIQIANDEINSKTELEKIELEDYTEQKKNDLDIYLTGRKPIQYGTIAELQASNNLKINDFVEVAGYYTVGDGAEHKRIISNVDDGSGVQLANGLWANVVHSNKEELSWYGAKMNGVTDDTIAINKYLNFKKYINLQDKKIKVDKINFVNGLHIRNGEIITTADNVFNYIENNINYARIKNIKFNGTPNSIFFGNNSGVNLNNVIIEDNTIDTVQIGISLNADLAGEVTNCVVRRNKISNIKGKEPGHGYGIHLAGADNCRVYDNIIDKAERHSVYHAWGFNNVIRNNVIKNHRQVTHDSSHRAGIAIYRKTQNLIVEGNKFFNCYDCNIHIECNSLEEGRRKGQLENVRVFNNTIIEPMNFVPAIMVGNVGEAQQSTLYVKNVYIYNNYIKSTNNLTQTLVSINSSKGVSFNNNIFDIETNKILSLVVFEKRFTHFLDNLEFVGNEFNIINNTTPTSVKCFQFATPKEPLTKIVIKDNKFNGIKQNGNYYTKATSSAVSIAEYPFIDLSETTNNGVFQELWYNVGDKILAKDYRYGDYLKVCTKEGRGNVAEFRDVKSVTTISALDTPYLTEKMKAEGVYSDFITYMDEKTAYDNKQREKEKAMQLAYEEALKENPSLTYEEFVSARPTNFSRRKRSLEIQEPVPSQALLEFKERYLG